MLWLWLLLLCVPLVAHADVDEFTLYASDSQIGSAALYVSGTYCGASGSFVHNWPTNQSPKRVFCMMLQVGGVLVSTVYDTDFPINQDMDGLGVTFDSTHFNDGNAVPVVFTIFFEDGASQSKSYTATVYNKAYILGNRTTNFGLLIPDDIEPIAASMNYTTRKSIRDDAATIVDNLPTYTAFFIYTHGSEDGLGSFIDCLSGLPPTPDHIVVQAMVQSAIQAKSTHNPALPPYTFVNLCTCDGADFMGMANKFGVSNSNDRAYLSFETEVESDQELVDWEKRVWQSLADGETLADAVNKSNMVAIPNIKPNDHKARPRIYGDGGMTMHNRVYGGDKGQWYRH